ncbi:molecular chaperone DnaJ [Marinobacter maroccanus]|uniref:Molecular chaperone DnaJ n=1 Tax=Marinobacter maroccanus TaxID=2055143 RepID=A0A2S5ZBK8_9GAMM|nr:DNA-J related domain-containing protein [Marinobacter maroccanus]PPI84769.1 molecular chaperone DnaJ [Marinobacter maroccanus]
MTDSHSPINTSYPGAANEDDCLEQQIQHLLVAVEHELRSAPAGMNELSLIKALQKPPWKLLGDVVFNEPEKLYPVHFLLFHVLYRLRDQLSEAGESLTISPLIIRIEAQTVVSGEGVPDSVDALRHFYLDLSQYRLPEEAIQQMMNDFWAGAPGQAPAQSETREAAEALGFKSVPTDFPTVKKRFRRAVMHAHPDRGGKTETIQHLNQAFAVLKAHFRQGI